ncbi:GNAT family N-acetyltransferase [Aspergillus saccharolyticus JOP 1030-1]|uniref:Acyl-CoA N-acyltransferase n=1 Tax=Aspergillus saccharolyticus JOP 1030-1 TaxID=1450539 RepID=A0A318ZYM4_9EURO|nr:acyl-CoA N-acyltransferase [Aspergillus saccharolyticus JOP 1030-1]PYH49403.1 acyl-CoA N-acyltransferase [Aspergillus saccharolyticus JOP 1030-1]
MTTAQPPQSYRIIPAQTPDHLSAVHTLFRAYVQWLNIDLTFQDFETELNSLPGKYGAACGGDLLLAYSGTNENIPLGCVALRPLTILKTVHASTSSQDASPENVQIRYCEIKRLYVSPEARRMGLGKALVEAVVRRARELGYQAIRLDTLRTMEGPLRLYRAAGFVNVEAYYETPLVEETVFLGLDLRTE